MQSNKQFMHKDNIQNSSSGNARTNANHSRGQSNRFSYVNPTLSKKNTQKSQTPCIHYKKGKCTKNSCPFLHKDPILRA